MLYPNKYAPIIPGTLDFYPDKIHNKLIFSEKVPRATSINILKSQKNTLGASRKFKMRPN